MKQKEQELIIALADMGQCLHSHDDWWSEKFKEDSIRAQSLFNRDAELRVRFRQARFLLLRKRNGRAARNCS